MYAVVDINGFQYRIEKGETLRVPKFDLEVGSKLKISEVLLVTDGDSVSVGTPFVDGAQVEATVTGHGKDKKVVVFKKKRRKDYSVKRGHRQDFTEIKVDDILVNA
jgi:large subunit ribosomal protein L21